MTTISCHKVGLMSYEHGDNTYVFKIRQVHFYLKKNDATKCI